MESEITKIGKDYGVTLPPEVLKHMNVKQGERVVFELKKDGKVVLEKRPAVTGNGYEVINEDFSEGTKELLDRYDNTLRNLSD